MKISVELVPRNEAQLLADAATVRDVLPLANAFNIPDLMRFPLRSWEACAITSRILPNSIPHIRAIDIPPGDDLPMAQAILDAGLTEILVIKGDPPHDMSQITYPNSSEEIIRRFKRRHPKLRVYAGFDPYRQGFRDEMAEVARKLDAGADGFFTQLKNRARTVSPARHAVPAISLNSSRNRRSGSRASMPLGSKIARAG